MTTPGIDDLYETARQMAPFLAVRILPMLGPQDGLPMARSLLRAANASEAFCELVAGNCATLTVEHLVLEQPWSRLFSVEERVEMAREVFRDDDTEVTPGSGEIGRVAAGGFVPLGYFKDPEKSARTFRVIDGARYSFPGDMAQVAADGTLILLGRGSNVINSGGEKIFPEEVEEAVKRHEGIVDCLVVGVDDDRFGQAVTAVASLAPGADATEDDVIATVKQHLAGYKAPKRVVFVSQVPRAPNGKADYRTARQLAEQPA